MNLWCSVWKPKKSSSVSEIHYVLKSSWDNGGYLKSSMYILTYYKDIKLPSTCLPAHCGIPHRLCSVYIVMHIGYGSRQTVRLYISLAIISDLTAAHLYSRLNISSIILFCISFCIILNKVSSINFQPDDNITARLWSQRDRLERYVGDVDCCQKEWSVICSMNVSFCCPIFGYDKDMIPGDKIRVYLLSEEHRVVGS